MSILDDNLDVSRDVLFKAKLVDLIQLSNYVFAKSVKISNITYMKPSPNIKYKMRYKLRIWVRSRYDKDNNYNPQFSIAWMRDDSYIGQTVCIDDSSISLEEFEKNNGYLFETF
jgi:hypothetical protein